MEIGSLLHVVRRQPRSDVLHKNNKKFNLVPRAFPLATVPNRQGKSPGNEVTRSYFRFAPPLSSRDKTASNNSPPPGPKGWTCPRSCPGGMVAGKIEPCITTIRRGPAKVGKRKLHLYFFIWVSWSVFMELAYPRYRNILSVKWGDRPVRLPRSYFSPPFSYLCSHEYVFRTVLSYMILMAVPLRFR